MVAPQITGDHPLTVEIVTRTRVAWQGRADEVEAPGFLGEFGVLPEHALMLSSLRHGIVSIHIGAKAERFVVGPGFADVGPDHITLLVDHCESAQGIDKNAANSALLEAEAALAKAQIGSDDYRRALDALELAKARLEA